MQPGLRLDHAKVAVHVEHAAVAIAQKAEATLTQSAEHRCGARPAFDLLPCAQRFGPLVCDFIAERDFGCCIQPEQSVYDAKRDTGAIESICEFGYRAGDTLRQPLARRRALVVDTRRRLQIQKYDGGGAALMQ